MFGFTADPKQRVLRILQKEWRYLLRLSDIATRLTHDEDNKKRDAAIHELRRLRRFERREQMFAPVSKLKHAIQDMASKIEFDARTRRQLQNHVQELEALEARIADNLRGAVIVDQQLRSIIEKAPSGKIAFART